MKKLSPSNGILVTSLLLALPASAYADTYQIVFLPSAKADQVLGFVDTGVVLISQNVLGGFLTVNLFSGQVNTLQSAPALEPQQGSCPGIPAGFNNSNAGGRYACDNGYVGFASRFNTNGQPDGVYTGTIGDLVLVGGGSFDGGGIDAQGDFAWTDGLRDMNFAAIDETTMTPEPGSLLLVATGGIAGLAAMRRRRAIRPGW